MQNTHGRVLILVKLQALACNFTKIDTLPWVFFTFFKLYKCYQIAQRITFNIFLTSIFLFCPTEIASYADNNTPYVTRDCFRKILQKVEDSNILFKWFSNNYVVENVDKCHLLKSTSEEVGVKIENEIVKNSLQEKVLGIMIDNRLTFEPHVKRLCKKAGQKLHALARIANYMDIRKKRSIMNEFIFSHFSCCPLM